MWESMTRCDHYGGNTFRIHKGSSLWLIVTTEKELLKPGMSLHRMLSEDELGDAILLVFANKQDLPNAMSVSEITDSLGLHSLSQILLVHPGDMCHIWTRDR